MRDLREQDAHRESALLEAEQERPMAEGAYPGRRSHGFAAEPDPRVMEQLEAVAKKYKFANYAEYDDVDENIDLVMSGIDPDTKKYVGPDAVIKKDIAFIDSEKLEANDKKRQLEELQSKLKSLPESVKFPANIDLVESTLQCRQSNRTRGATKRRPLPPA
ncbi:MAG: hypothetical protein WA863_00040 [Methyloceanibacter sp.]